MMYGWCRGLVTTQGMFSPDKYSSFSHKLNFSQIKVDFVTFIFSVFIRSFLDSVIAEIIEP